MKLFKRIALIIILTICLTFLTSCCMHKYEETVIPPTCVDEGKTVRTCTKCGETENVDIVPALGHDLTVVEHQPNCDTEGYSEYRCHCGFSFIANIVSPKGHTLSNTVTDASCDSIGYTYHTCLVCGYEYVDEYVESLGHTFNKTVTSPSCKEEGYTTYTCKCGFSYTADYTKPKGHNLKTTVLEPTCTDTGYTTYTCDCGYSYVTDFIKPLGHDLKETVLEPTCTDTGYTTYFCDCGYSFVSDLVSPTGHMFSEAVTMPTVATMGYTDYTCSCGFKYTGNYRFYSEILDNAYAGNSIVLANGIDVSKHNHDINDDKTYKPLDWEAIKASGVDYVILKIGSTLRSNGTLGGLESTFEMDYAGAKAAGLNVGVYFFTYATNVSQIKKDAEILLTWLEGKQFEYPVYLDLEDVPSEDYYPGKIASPILTEMCLTFFSALQKEGYYTGLYVNNTFLNSVLQTENMIELFEIWYARYPINTEDYEWDTEKYGENLGMWQYSQTGKLEAVSNKPFDLNYAYKDYPTLIKSYGFNGY